MAKRSIQTFPIDTVALRNEFTKRNLTLAGASVDMGHCDTYLNVKFNTKKMHENDAKMLELLYHIPREAYELKDEVEEVVEVLEDDPLKEAKFDYEELYRTIYSAVYAAVKEAFN